MAKKDELTVEYKRDDLGTGRRAKHIAAYRKGTNLVRLSADAAPFFPTEKAVNDALRSLLKIARRTTEDPSQ